MRRISHQELSEYTKSANKLWLNRVIRPIRVKKISPHYLNAQRLPSSCHYCPDHLVILPLLKKIRVYLCVSVVKFSRPSCSAPCPSCLLLNTKIHVFFFPNHPAHPPLHPVYPVFFLYEKSVLFRGSCLTSVRLLPCLRPALLPALPAAAGEGEAGEAAGEEAGPCPKYPAYPPPHPVYPVLIPPNS